MTSGGTPTPAPPVSVPARRVPAGAVQAFLAILGRDLFVTGAELPVFLAQAILQPLFMAFVFGKVLIDLGFASPAFAQLLLPGLVALTIMLTALQSTALPLVIDFSFTKEIEDRLLAPLPLSMVAVEKMLFATLRALVAGTLMLPIGRWIIGPLSLQADRVWILILFMVLGALAGSGMGMLLGTIVPPKRINIMFALVLTPLLFTGCVQYPWPSLTDLRWFQVVTLFNPITYASEGIRSAMLPLSPHMTTWKAAAALAAVTVVLAAAGIAGFLRRAVD
jgi:ABC-2 type transport system permease protein